MFPASSVAPAGAVKTAATFFAMLPGLVKVCRELAGWPDGSADQTLTISEPIFADVIHRLTSNSIELSE